MSSDSPNQASQPLFQPAQFLGEAGFDPQFGERLLKRVLQYLILNDLSKGILSGRVSKDAMVEAVLEDGAVKFENVEMPAV